MVAERVSVLVPCEDLGAAVTWWREVLGVEPTFVDGDRWAQFDVGAGRLALAGRHHAGEPPAVMVKVDDLDAVWERWRARGAGPMEHGSHERSFTATDPAGQRVVFYEPVPPG